MMKSYLKSIPILFLISFMGFSFALSADTGLNEDTSDTQAQQVEMQDISIYENLVPGVDFAPGEVLVVFEPGLVPTGSETRDLSSVSTEIIQFSADHNLSIHEVIPLGWGTLYRMDIQDNARVFEKVVELYALPEIRLVEPNGILYLFDTPVFPNDPLWEAEYDDDDDPKTVDDEQFAPAKIGADSAWHVTKGDNIVVAVIDTGVNWDHEDLLSSMWVNVDEIDGNGIDDDDNGYIDDIYGWDFYGLDPDIRNYGELNAPHGTRCAAIIAAEQGNSLEMSGIAPNALIMGLKVHDSNGAFHPFEGTLVSCVASAVNYAIEKEADIINMSFGGPIPFPSWYFTIADAWSNDILIVAAAGNCNAYNPLVFPANWGEVICVGATTTFKKELGNNYPIDEVRITPDLGYKLDNLCPTTSGSNYGPQLDCMAFGARIITLGGYDVNDYVNNFGGTSAAAPMVSAVAALYIKLHPSFTNLTIREHLMRSSDDLDVPGKDDQTGFGRVNAIRLVYGPDRYQDEEDAYGFVDIGPHDSGVENQVIDSINNNPDNEGYPVFYRDEFDYYKITTDVQGKLTVILDIYTWGEDLDLAIYSDPQLTDLIDSDDDPNSYADSKEQVIIVCESGQTYYIRVSAAHSGDSSSYELSATVEPSANPCDPDGDAPDTFIDSGCYDRPAVMSLITIGVSGSDPLNCTDPSALTYEWQKRKSGEDWPDPNWNSSSSTMIQVDGLTEGNWQIRVRAIDEAGNKDGTPAICSFTNGEGEPCYPDNDPPTTSIDSGCDDRTVPESSITLWVSGNDNCTDASNLVYEWQKTKFGNLWPDEWEYSSSNMIQVEGLFQGYWEIRIRSIDESGNKDGSPIYCSFNNGANTECYEDYPENDPCTGARVVNDGAEISECVDDGDPEDWFKFTCPSGTDVIDIDMWCIIGNSDMYLYTSCSDGPDDYIKSSAIDGCGIWEEIYIDDDLPYTEFYLKVINSNVGGRSEYDLNFISWVCLPPCTFDTTPPEILSVSGCEDKDCGTTSVELLIDATDDCTSPSNLEFEWQIKDNWDSWPEIWNVSTEPTIVVPDLMTGTWDFWVRAVDEAGNKETDPYVCSFSILCPSPGDLNCSGCVDCQSGGWPGDVLPIIQRWHAEEGQPGWDNIASMADCAGYGDGYIDVNDIINIGIFWKEGC